MRRGPKEEKVSISQMPALRAPVSTSYRSKLYLIAPCGPDLNTSSRLKAGPA